MTSENFCKKGRKENEDNKRAEQQSSDKKCIMSKQMKTWG